MKPLFYVLLLVGAFASGMPFGAFIAGVEKGYEARQRPPAPMTIRFVDHYVKPAASAQSPPDAVTPRSP